MGNERLQSRYGDKKYHQATFFSPIGANSATLVIADELCKLRRVASHVNLRMRGRTRVIVFVVLRLASFQCAIEVPPFTGGGVGSVAPLDVPP